MVLGLVFYFCYGYRKSRMRAEVLAEQEGVRTPA